MANTKQYTGEYISLFDHLGRAAGGELRGRGGGFRSRAVRSVLVLPLELWDMMRRCILPPRQLRH